MSAGTLRDLAGRVGSVHGHPGKASREVQGVAAGDRISGTGSVGLPERLTSPGRRYSDMSACVYLYSVTDSQDQDSSTALHCMVSMGDGRVTGLAADGAQQASLMQK
jgi:hypothetical protein